METLQSSRVLIQEEVMSPKAMRSVRSALSQLDRLMEPQYALTQGVLERIAIDLPRAMRDGPDNIMQLVVRFCGKKFEVLYVGLDAIESTWPEKQTLAGFDPILMVKDFSDNFGWVENLQLEHEKALLSGQREQLRHIVEDIATIEAHLPPRLYISPKGRVCKRRPKDGFSMNLRIDVVLSTVSYWLAYYQVDEDICEEDGVALRFGVFFNSKTPPPPLGYWHRYRLTGLDLLSHMVTHYGINLEKKPTKRTTR